MASKKQNETLSEAPDGPTTVSVYDFLYHDARRVASFLAQFDRSGHLTQVAQSARIARVRDESDKTSGTLALVSSEMTKSASDEHGKESQRIYDPTWANARALLDYLDEAGRIQRDIEAAQIGQFVLVSGSLSLSDLGLMEKTWRLPVVKKMMAAGIDETSKLPAAPKGMRNNPELLMARKAAEEGLKTLRNGLDMFFELITVLPHTIQARLTGDDVSVWCSLSREDITFEASDIVLKYGSEIPGRWHILGILDAQPDSIDAPGDVDFGQGQEMAANMMGIIAPLTRNMLGRPTYSYGLTPLLVFRAVED